MDGWMGGWMDGWTNGVQIRVPISPLFPSLPVSLHSIAHIEGTLYYPRKEEREKYINPWADSPPPPPPPQEEEEDWQSVSAVVVVVMASIVASILFALKVWI